MIKFIRFMRKRRVSVKPITPYMTGFGWVVTQGNTWTEFVDDWRRAGFRVALWNIHKLWRLEE